MKLKNIREFHWFTWLVIVLVFLVMALCTIFIANMTGQYGIASGMIFILLIVLVIIALAAIISRLKFTGIIAEGDIHVFRTWLEKEAESPGEPNTEISELKDNIMLLKQSLKSIETKVDNISEILEKVSD